MSAALSNKQKGYLAQLANRAFDREAEPGLDRGQWRHEQVAAACGKLGLRCCGQEDYRAVEAHFLALLGDVKGVFRAKVREATNGRRVAEYKLGEACRKAGVQWEYAEAICRTQNGGLSIAEVSEKRVWGLVFTVNNRRAKR